MKLYIDTSQGEKIKVKLNDKAFETDARKEKSQKLLPFIRNVLEKEGCDIHDVDEIEVNTGPGSYTGLRVGVAIAISIGWVLGIPVNGKNIRKGETIDIVYD